MRLHFLAISLICGGKSYSKYPMFIPITVFMAQGLRPVLKAPLNTGFDDRIAPLWVLEKDAGPCRHNPSWLWMAAL